MPKEDIEKVFAEFQKLSDQDQLVFAMLMIANVESSSSCIKHLEK
jgi:hypothetical protein